MDNVIYEKMIEGMCYTQRHDFELLNAEAQENIRSQMRQLFEHNIKPVIDSLETKENPVRMSAIDDISLIKELSASDAKLVNMAFGVSESLGLAAFDNSTHSFQAFLREQDSKFIPGMSIEWRAYLVELLLQIDERYRDSVTAKVLLGR